VLGGSLHPDCLGTVRGLPWGHFAGAGGFVIGGRRHRTRGEGIRSEDERPR
jgi:hypothetical protein